MTVEQPASASKPVPPSAQFGRVLYVQYANPSAYPPLEHSSQLLAREGAQVLFLGIGSARTHALDFPPRKGIELKRMPYCAPGWRQKLHYLRFMFWVCLWTLRWRPDAIYLSDPLVCPIGVVLRRLSRAKLLYHEHDGAAEQALRSNTWFARLVDRSRTLLAHSVQASILPNAGRAEQFREDTGVNENILCVWNCPRREEVRPRTSRRGKSPYVRFHYHGNIGPELVPLTLVQALGLVPGACLRIVGYVSPGCDDHMTALQRMAEENGSADRLQVLAARPRHRLMELLPEADVGIAFMPMRTNNHNFRHMVGASNKAFDYLAGGLPLLLSDMPEWVDAYVKPGYGLACRPDDVQSVVGAFNWFVQNPDAREAMGAKGQSRILADWNYETQFAPVMKILAKKPGASNGSRN